MTLEHLMKLFDEYVEDNNCGEFTKILLYSDGSGNIIDKDNELLMFSSLDVLIHNLVELPVGFEGDEDGC